MRKLPHVFSHINLNTKNKSDSKWSAPVKVDQIITSKPLKVENYEELVKLNAQLLYRNRNITLFYRGQEKEHIINGAASILPTIFRKNASGKILNLKKRFQILETDVQELKRVFNNSEIKLAGTSLINKYPEIVWSILQHYNICDTPLIDLTQSLHVACSFAFDQNKSKTGIVYVFGLPWASDSIGYNTYEELVNIRLLSACPPQATRPFFQECYLAGPFPNYNLDSPSRRNQFDFGRRLIAKFEIPNNNSFWGAGFRRIPRNKLFPLNDRVEELCNSIRKKGNLLD